MSEAIVISERCPQIIVNRPDSEDERTKNFAVLCKSAYGWLVENERYKALKTGKEGRAI